MCLSRSLPRCRVHRPTRHWQSGSEGAKICRLECRTRVETPADLPGRPEFRRLPRWTTAGSPQCRAVIRDEASHFIRGPDSADSLRVGVVWVVLQSASRGADCLGGAGYPAGAGLVVLSAAAPLAGDACP